MTEVRPARDQAEVDAALALRYDVFCIEQGVSLDEQLRGQPATAMGGRDRHASELDLRSFDQQAAGADQLAVLHDDEMQRLAVAPVALFG